MELNYQELEFKCGLECHQQLSGRKLFCNCPTLNSDKDADIKVERKLRAVAGETGDVDVAAEFEMSKKKRFLYESNSEDTCLVEYDEEPPHGLNREVLETTIKVALLLNAKPIDEIQVMRKTVVDGSNVSGFQRTILIATNGFIKTSKGNVKIPTICLEEEAAKKIKQEDNDITYNLDRLGIPLIEIATDASIKDPDHAKETAELIGMILKSTGNFKSGLGTISQDVNVSIKGHPRVELKGFQDLKGIPKTVETEIKRQLENLKLKKEIKSEVRKVESDFTSTFLRPMPTSARMYPESDIKQIRITKELLCRKIFFKLKFVS